MPPKQPAAGTLDKYGFSSDDFWALWKAQGEACGVCHEDVHPRYVIDHEHVAGWKNMEPDRRKLYVRGIVGIAENHWLLTRYMNAARAKLVASYLVKYEKRRP